MKLYAATITDKHGGHTMLFRAYRRPSADHVRHCLRLVPDSKVEFEYVGDLNLIPLVSPQGPLKVEAPGPGKASR